MDFFLAKFFHFSACMDLFDGPEDGCEYVCACMCVCRCEESGPYEMRWERTIGNVRFISDIHLR